MPISEDLTAPFDLDRAWAWAYALTPMLAGEARTMLPSSDVEDAVSEARIRLVDKALRGRIRPNGARDPAAWIRTIVRNVLRDIARRVLRRYERLTLSPDIEPPAPPAREAIEDWRTWGMGAVDGLVLVAFEAPDSIEANDIAAASDESRGDVGLTRTAEDTWRRFVAWRASPSRTDPELLFVLRGPPDREAWTEAEAKRARDWSYQRRRRARRAAERFNPLRE